MCCQRIKRSTYLPTGVWILFQCNPSSPWFFCRCSLLMWHIVWTHGRNIKTYIGFRTFSAGDVNEDYVNSLDMVSLFRQPSTWSMGANDLLLALANHTGRIVKIFCSQKQQPVTDTQPTLTKSDIFHSICMLFLAPAATPEHYDGCILRNKHLCRITFYQNGHNYGRWPYVYEWADWWRTNRSWSDTTINSSSE